MREEKWRTKYRESFEKFKIHIFMSLVSNRELTTKKDDDNYQENSQAFSRYKTAGSTQTLY